MFFKVKLFWPYLSNDWSNWCETKRRWVNRILGQLYDLGLWPHPNWVSRSESEIALSQEWDGPLTWNVNDVSHTFMTMILTSVTMVGWVDVPDSDWGDFRCWSALDISSLLLRPVALNYFFCETFLAATKQLYKWYFPSVCPSVRLSVCPSVCHTFLTMFPSLYHHEIFRSYDQWPK